MPMLCQTRPFATLSAQTEPSRYLSDQARPRPRQDPPQDRLPCPTTAVILASVLKIEDCMAVRKLIHERRFDSNYAGLTIIQLKLDVCGERALQTRLSARLEERSARFNSSTRPNCGGVLHKPQQGPPAHLGSPNRSSQPRLSRLQRKRCARGQGIRMASPPAVGATCLSTRPCFSAMATC